MKVSVLSIAVLALVSVSVLPATAAAPTARASAALPIHSGPGDNYRVVGMLGKNERVHLDDCTRRARWCHVVRLGNGPEGWVDGSYLIGSPAKSLVTPFEFLVNPGFPHHFGEPF